MKNLKLILFLGMPWAILTAIAYKALMLKNFTFLLDAKFYYQVLPIFLIAGIFMSLTWKKIVLKRKIK